MIMSELLPSLQEGGASWEEEEGVKKQNGGQAVLEMKTRSVIHLKMCGKTR